MIQAIDVHKTFSSPQSLHVLKGINLEVQPGELLCVIGASGVGKSTLLHILGTLDRPSRGTLLFGGKNVFELNEQGLADFRNRTIGFVFQFHHLLPEFTALENVMMPALINGQDYREASDGASRLLSEVGLSERIAHRPGELSGGEQQRVAVARALVLQPRLLLADEPTGNLDTRTGEDVFSIMRKMNKQRGTTFILVTHNERLSSQADRIVRMVDGRMEAV
jgi:lipoprotein-releasing system ATP-binding protein